MRFSDSTRESNLFQSAGFYANRLTYSEVVLIFQKHRLEVLREERFEHGIKPSRGILSKTFTVINDADLNAVVKKLISRACTA